MKGSFAVALLCILSNLCQAAAQPALHGTIHFSGAVVGSNCSLTSYDQGGLSEHCPLNAVAHTLSVQTLGNAEAVRVRATPLAQGNAKGDQQYVLVGLSGSLITQGHYVVTQSLQ